MRVVDLDVSVSQREFAAIVGISEPAVSQLRSRGVLREGEALGHWLRAYVAGLRESAAARIGDLDESVREERRRLLAAKALEVERKNAKAARELVACAAVEELLADVGRQVAGILDGIPGELRRRYPSLPGDALSLVADEVARARNAIAGITLESLAGDPADRLADAEDRALAVSLDGAHDER